MRQQRSMLRFLEDSNVKVKKNTTFYLNKKGKLVERDSKKKTEVEVTNVTAKIETAEVLNSKPSIENIIEENSTVQVESSVSLPAEEKIDDKSQKKKKPSPFKKKEVTE